MPDIPLPLNQKYTYNTIFRDVCRTRFNHLVTRFIPVTVVIESLAITLVSTGYNSSFEYIFNCSSKFLSIYLASIIIVFTRKNYLHVHYLNYSNIFTSILGKFLSIKSVIYLITHSVSCILVSSAFKNCYGMSSVAVLHISHYEVYTWAIIPFLYTCQHVLFDLDRLPFQFEVQHQSSKQYLLKKIYPMAIKCGIFCLLICVSSPFIFKLTIGIWSPGFKSQVQLLVLSLFTVLNLDFINASFNAHLIIGCLHKGKPLSTLSLYPVETLISGLHSSKYFTKLTAFQELSYRATSSDSSLREPIYQARFKNVNIWPSILKECTLVIEENNKSIKIYIQTLKNTTEPSLRDHINNLANFQTQLEVKNEKIFGKELSISRSGIHNNTAIDSLDASNISNMINLQDGNILLNRKSKINQNISLNPNRYLKSTHSFDEPIITHKTKLMIAIQKMIPIIRTFLKKHFLFSENSQNEIQQLSILDGISISKIRISERLVPVPAIQAYCIISLMGLFLNGLDEDPKGSIVSSVGDVLKDLERSVATLGKYADWKPLPQVEDRKPVQLDNISRLYELSICVFLEIVLKYNVLLNDVYLDDNVVILSKWVLDICNTELQ